MILLGEHQDFVMKQQISFTENSWSRSLVEYVIDGSWSRIYIIKWVSAGLYDLSYSWSLINFWSLRLLALLFRGRCMTCDWIADIPCVNYGTVLLAPDGERSTHDHWVTLSSFYATWGISSWFIALYLLLEFITQVEFQSMDCMT